MKKGKWTLSLLVPILLFSTVVVSPEASANSLDEMEQQKKIYEEKKIELKSGINEKETELNTNQSKVDEIRGQIQALDAKVKETNSNIAKVEKEIADTKNEVEELHKSIKALEKKIKERDLVLRDRVRALQVNGGSVNYLDVLLGANSFSDFIDRYSAVTTLVEADKKIMEEQAKDKEQLEVEKKLVEKKLKEQEVRKAELSNLKASLDTQKKEKDQLVKKLQTEQKKLNNEKASLETSYEETHKMSEKVEQGIIEEQKRRAEEARKAEEERKRIAAEEEKERQAAAQAAKSAQSSQSSSSGKASSATPPPATPPPAMSSGSWTRPAAGRITSTYGYRIHPIHGTSRLHRGTDIANAVGTPIVAAGDGVVSTATRHSSLGNYIVVTHSIDGKIFTTVYAHLSSLGVSAGQHVSKGQVIGKMGSTGDSTGPHLHFEFHIGYFSWSGPSAVNPGSYVPL